MANTGSEVHLSSSKPKPILTTAVNIARPKPDPVEGLQGPHDLALELWREYDFGGRVYRISDPSWL